MYGYRFVFKVIKSKLQIAEEMIYVKKFYFFTARTSMRFLHILLFLLGVQLMINGAFFSSPLLTALGASSVSLFLLI